MALDSRGFAVTPQALAVVEIHGWNIKALQCNRKCGVGQKLFFSGKHPSEAHKLTSRKGLRAEKGRADAWVTTLPASKSLTSEAAGI
jgi:hypothetical protein